MMFMQHSYDHSTRMNQNHHITTSYYYLDKIKNKNPQKKSSAPDALDKN